MELPVKAIVFDYGNVLARFTVTKYLTGIAPYSPLGFDELRRVLKESTDLFLSYETGEISSRDFYTKTCERCSLSLGWDDFVDAYVRIFMPLETTQNLVRLLKPSYRLGLLSNTSELHFIHEIERNPVFPLFDAVTLSFRVRARKPMPAIYEDMLSKLQLEPGACIYIDDMEEYALAAKDAGMKGIHYTTHEDLLRSLEGHGVSIPPGA